MNHSADVFHLLATHMVELKNNPIAFAAINAWVLVKIRVNKISVLPAINHLSCVAPSIVDRTMLLIVFPAINALAFLAVRCQ